MTAQFEGAVVNVLLVEDSESDIEFTVEGFKQAHIANRLHVVRDGDAAIAFLRRRGEFADVPRPDLVLLDLNLPRKHGLEVLTEIKEDPALRHIPVVIMSTSSAPVDIHRSYHFHANCYITKPAELDNFLGMIGAIEDFWFSRVQLPRDSVH